MFRLGFITRHIDCIFKFWNNLELCAAYKYLVFLNDDSIYFGRGEKKYYPPFNKYFPNFI